MLRTKSIHAPPEPDDGTRILITRFYPRGVKRERFHEWERALAPSARLLKQYKNAEIAEEEFMRLFRLEMCTTEGRRAIGILRFRATSSTLTLLCHERSGNLCHRHILREIIMDAAKLTASFKPEYTDHHE